MGFRIGQAVRFAGADSVVRDKGLRGGRPAYLIDNGSVALPMWVLEDILESHQRHGSAPYFNQRTPSVIIVDDFLREPDEVRDLALAQEFQADERHFKGVRST